ncbi:hypothetical protein [Actinoplanes sp. URMC 104]|uniref:hypothetical protein n=1 Tax=Actinoplanes sp. URMC 104 TaxID=3423409 RepID=UPI003F1C2474
MPDTVADVAILSDFRLAGAGVAAEVRAQAEAALSTVLVHVPLPETRPAPFDPAIRVLLRDGLATLAHDDRPVAARLLVVRGTRRLTEPMPEVRAERTVVIADEPPALGLSARDVDWAPVDEHVRAAMPLLCRLTPQNWHQITDAAAGCRGDLELFRTLERATGHQSHLRRLAALGVRPRINAPARRAEPAALPVARARRVLMVGDDATSLVAIARRLPGDLSAVIVTRAHQPGFLTEHIPSRELLRDRLGHLVDLHRPEAVMVAGVPHGEIADVVREHPGQLWVWLRHAMWQRGVGQEWITEGKVFDHVLEPGEFAALVDEGATVGDRAGAHRVEPITLLDGGDLLDAAAARAELALDERPAALIRLGDPLLGARVAERLRLHGFQVVRVEPGSRCLRAFDLVVSSAAYHPYHEQLRFGVPTVFVPDSGATVDDEAARARYADAAGVALTVADPGSNELERALDAAARAEVRAALRRRCDELTFANGAAPAATWLSGLLARRERIGG